MLAPDPIVTDIHDAVEVDIGYVAAVSGPEILPPGLRTHGGGDGSFNPGAALAMLAFGIPVTLLCDLLLRRKQT